MDETTATLILTHTPFLGPVKITTLIRHFGTAEKTVVALAKAPGLRKETTDFILDFENKKNWQNDLQTACRDGVTLIPITSSAYPERLKVLHDSPPLLYVKGKLPEKSSPWVAIVGTRTSTYYGNDTTAQFAEQLARAGCIVVSGLARGIDTHAHMGSLKAGPTVAVIGSGLADVYPRENIGLAHTIEKTGAVLSELPMNEAPSRYSFPKRNRLIAALSDAILLTEAPEKSGAMITMEIGAQQNKLLFALPSRAGSESSQGNHLLIKKGVARLVDRAEEILIALDHNGHIPKIEKIEKITDFLFSADEQKIVACLKESELSLEQLSNQISLPISTLQATLIKLTLKKILLELPGKRYTLTN